ncbi:hypothetical protein MLD52_15210 [Puniceicoccaceae bacterium K14]|nr:hypothetical protein [Puniceicoccaceae bacterium K14]
MSLWSATSFIKQFGTALPVIIHDDGTLTSQMKSRIKTQMPGIRIICREESDAIAEEKLANYPNCLKFRSTYNNSIKLFDPWLVADAEDIISLDSDLLFFAPQKEIIEWSQGERKTNLWNEDTQTAYTIPPAEIHADLGIKMIERINSGFGAVARESFDLDLLEKYLSHPKAFSHFWRIEQTGFAIMSCKFSTKLLPSKYLISTDTSFGIPEGTVMKHYIGAVRGLFYTEGIPNYCNR